MIHPKSLSRRGMPSTQYRLLIQRAGKEKVVSVKYAAGGIRTYNLELQWYDSEIQNLHCRPDHVVRFQSGNVNVLEFLHNRSLPTTFGNRHESEEDGQTDRRKDQLVECDSFQRGYSHACLGKRKRPRQEAVPFVLHRCNTNGTASCRGRFLLPRQA